MGNLDCLQPKNVFQFFEKICSVPHGSGNTDGIVNYLLQFAEERGLECWHDDVNNVIIRKEGSLGYEDSEPIILQGHHDMVCEKDEGIEFNFDTDSIQPFVDGDWIRARGTSLGGDDGIAVAMILAILDDDTLQHPPIEALITADEEIGMPGAFGFDCAQLVGRKLVNLDSEMEGVLLCSCAGGINVRSTIPVEYEDVEGVKVTIQLKDFTSGHSGVEIDKGRANANMLMGRLLDGLNKQVNYSIAALAGGTRETAIASTASATLITDDVKTLQHVADSLFAQYAKEYAITEPSMKMSVTCSERGIYHALNQHSVYLITKVLLALPDGVQAMSVDMPGLVQTSTNCGLIKLTDSAFTVTNTVRSSISSQKYWIKDKIAAIISVAGGESTVDGDYPGWAYNPNSPIKDALLKAYKQVVGTDAKVDAVHAGLECGIFADRVGLDCVAIGPEMADVHTPRERLSISSSARLYEVLKVLLAESK